MGMYGMYGMYMDRFDRTHRLSLKHAGLHSNALSFLNNWRTKCKRFNEKLNGKYCNIYRRV